MLRGSMKASALLLLLASGLQAANLWDGGAGDGLYSTATNWDNDTPPGFSGTVTFPAADWPAAWRKTYRFPTDGHTGGGIGESRRP